MPLLLTLSNPVPIDRGVITQNNRRYILKKYLSTIGVSLMVALTATTLSAAEITEEGGESDRYFVEGIPTQVPKECYPLLRQYELALTSNNLTLVESIKESLLLSGDNWILWRAVSAAMKQAYYEGNIEALESIKTSVAGFPNINDLGDPFFKYGSGMHKWDQLILDATANQTK